MDVQLLPCVAFGAQSQLVPECLWLKGYFRSNSHGEEDSLNTQKFQVLLYLV